MKNKCMDCPRTKEYLDMGRCPNCGSDGFMMNTKTCIAICRACNIECGIPIAINGLCYEDELHKCYDISIEANLNKQQLLEFSKIIGMNGSQTYGLFKNNSPVVLKNIPMLRTYIIRDFFRKNDCDISIDPQLGEYPCFEECHGLK